MSSWNEQIEGAGSVPELVAVARDWLCTWSPEELALLPSPCRPGRIRTGDDIEELNAAAVECFRLTRASGEELTALQRFTGLFSRAAVRLAHLRNAGKDSGSYASRPDLDRNRPGRSGR